MKGNENGGQNKQSNFPGINDEYNVVAAQRKPSAEVGWISEASNSKVSDHQQRNKSKASPGKGSSRGTAHNETPGGAAWQRPGGKPSPLTPVGITNRKKAALVSITDGNSGVAPGADLDGPNYYSQMKDKHKSIDEAKLKVNRGANHKEMAALAPAASRNYANVGHPVEPDGLHGKPASN